MEKISDRISKGLEMRQMKQVDLVELTQIGKSSISTYISGAYEPKQRNIYKIAKALNVSEAWLMGYDAPIERTETPPKSIFEYENIIPLPKTYKVPLIGDIAYGTPILAEENIKGYIELSEDVRADFCLRCHGDSMINARIFDGDIVFVRSQQDVEDGQIAVVLIDDEATLKRVYHENNELTLRAENPTFPAIIKKGEELDSVCIQGLAVAFLGAVK